MFDPFKQRAFDLKILDDGLDYEIAVLELAEVVIKIAYGNKRSVIGYEKSSGLSLFGSLESAVSDPISNSVFAATRRAPATSCLPYTITRR